MCGISGSMDLQGQNVFQKEMEHSLELLSLRGPDNQASFHSGSVHLGHTRLSIIDLSDHANQPLISQCGNYILVFNGEIYNFQEIKKELEHKYEFKTDSDSEVLLYSYVEFEEKCLNKLNGFFSFAVYNKEKKNLFLARDRFGIKPLYYYQGENSFFFASELKALTCYPIPREINEVSKRRFFEFTYIDGEESIYKHVKRLSPGSYINVNENHFTIKKYYNLQYPPKNYLDNYEMAQSELREKLDKSVERRLISDAPLGAFLSGGIDSSVIVALASRHKENLKTFSIGYKENSIHDETRYAEAVARKCNTDHITLKISEDDYVENIYEILNYLDEPFADSSMIPTYILSKLVKKHVTVALSGDGADELFAGYNKYHAEIYARNLSSLKILFKGINPVLDILPQSRDFSLLNRLRQVKKFSKIVGLNPSERYFDLCRFNSKKEISNLLVSSKDYIESEYQYREIDSDINSVLYNDIHNILPGDMLTKVDRMSMANSLEVRVPFLDHEVVELAFKLPEKYKINSKMKKIILQEAFRNDLPDILYKRPKQGFSLSLMKFFKYELWSLIDEDLMSEKFINEQRIFNFSKIKEIKKSIKNNEKEDIQALVWSLIVFQSWWKKYFH